MKPAHLLLIFPLLLSAVSLLAQPGILDQAFAGDGLATVQVGTIQFSQGQCMALTPDQKVVVAGSYNQDSSIKSFAAIRYLSNGNLDPAFGTGGIVTLPLGINGTGVTGVAVQSDGSIVLVGAYFFGLNIVGAVYRLTPGGQQDPNFHGGGVLLVSNYQPTSVSMTPSGKIAVGCINGVFRVKADGDLDNNFGTGGLLNTGKAIYNTCLIVQTDGMIVVGGYTNSEQKVPSGMVRRYTTSGPADPSFGIGGQMNVSAGDEGTLIFGVALQTDSKILLAGSYAVYNNGNWEGKGLVERVNTNGTMDDGFAGNGKQQVVFTLFDQLFGIAEQTDGKIVAAGTAQSNSGPLKIALCRLNADGSMNSAFGTGGKVITTWPNEDVQINSVGIQTDGKIVLGGSAGGFSAARYQVTKIPSAAIGPTLQTGQVAISEYNVNLRVFPNPASSLLQVQGMDGNSPTILRVIDGSGKILLKVSVDQVSTVLNIEGLTPGVYYLELMTGTKQQTVPFVKGP